jgi:hypothetical protein
VDVADSAGVEEDTFGEGCFACEEREGGRTRSARWVPRIDQSETTDDGTRTHRQGVQSYVKHRIGRYSVLSDRYDAEPKQPPQVEEETENSPESICAETPIFLCRLSVTKSFSLNSGNTLSFSSASTSFTAAAADAYRRPRTDGVGTTHRAAIAVFAGVARTVNRRAAMARGREAARRTILEQLDMLGGDLA